MKEFGVVSELCPHCNTEVEISCEIKRQKCPSCGEMILPCAMCEMDHASCMNCKY